MDKVLIDTSTFFDIRRAPKKTNVSSAQNTLYNLLRYQSHHTKLTVSAFTVFEHLDGLFRQGRQFEASEFRSKVLPTVEVIYADESIHALAAEIHAALALTGRTIGIADTFIAASAIDKKITLVNANAKHFQRVVDAGFKLALDNWREA